MTIALIILLIGILCVTLPFALKVISFVWHGYRKAQQLHTKTPITEFYQQQKASDTYCPMSEISTVMKFIVVCLEDIPFFRHKGFNLYRILYAIYINFRHKRRKMGGSTITQQLAKNIYLPFNKSFKRKIPELFLALKIEKYLTKEEILELYLNIIFYGHNINGIKGACEFYFQKSPAEITLNEAITLTCLLPAPSIYAPLLPDSKFELARRAALKRLVHRKAFSPEHLPLIENASYNEILTHDTILQYEAQYNDFYEQLKKRKKPF